MKHKITISLCIILLSTICAALDSCHSSKKSAIVSDTSCSSDSASQVMQSHIDLHLANIQDELVIDSVEIIFPSAVLPNFADSLPKAVIRARRISIGGSKDIIDMQLSDSLAATALSSRCNKSSDVQTQSQQTAAYKPPNLIWLGVAGIIVAALILACICLMRKLKH